MLLEPADREEGVAVEIAEALQWQVVGTVGSAGLVQACSTASMATPGDLDQFDVFFSTDVALSHICASRMSFEKHVLCFLKLAIPSRYGDPRRISFFIELDSPKISVKLLQTLNPTMIHRHSELSYRVEVDVTLLLR